MVRLTDRPDRTLDVYRGRKTIIQQQQLVKCKKGSFKYAENTSKQIQPHDIDAINWYQNIIYTFI